MKLVRACFWLACMFKNILPFCFHAKPSCDVVWHLGNECKLCFGLCFHGVLAGWRVYWQTKHNHITTSVIIGAWNMLQANLTCCVWHVLGGFQDSISKPHGIILQVVAVLCQKTNIEFLSPMQEKYDKYVARNYNLVLSGVSDAPLGV